MRTSATAIECFDQGCMLKYYRKYITRDMIKVPANRWLTLGNIIHSTYEQIFKFGIFNDTRYLLNLYTKHFNTEFEKSEKIVEQLSSKDRSWIYKYGKQLLLYGYQTLEKNNLLRTPVSVEEWFEVPLCGIGKFSPATIDVIVGKIDAIFDIDDKFLIIDYKTGKQMPTKTELRKNLQLTTYAFVVKQLYGKDSEQGLLYNKHRIILKTKRKKSDFTKLISILSEMKKFENEIELNKIDANYTPSIEACKYCELKETCKGPREATLK